MLGCDSYQAVEPAMQSTLNSILRISLLIGGWLYQQLNCNLCYSKPSANIGSRAASLVLQPPVHCSFKVTA